MKYYSTNDRNLKVDLKTAITRSLAVDKGLYMPETFPQLDKSFFSEIEKIDFPELSYRISKKLFGKDIPDNDLQNIVYEALYFDTPLVKIAGDISTLELFHGPTLAFKDVGARFMARMLQFFIKEQKNETHVLVATSGDTGSAVANGFLGVEGIKVHVLYPKGLVSNIQEKQFTTLGENISALEIEGNFDDCQRLVKSAFADKTINEKLSLTSANSINLARLIPQSFYYFNAYRQAERKDNLVICVPSGNFGNLTAGLFAKKMGLPVKHFISATNVNDIVPKYLITGKYNPRPSVATLANAMDVGDPSNFARILDIFDHSHDKIKSGISGYSYTDDDIRNCITSVSERFNYITDPHGATGFMACEEYKREHTEDQLIFLETAHPAKFIDTMEEILQKKMIIPERLSKFLNREKKSIKLTSDFDDFREYLLNF